MRSVRQTSRALAIVFLLALPFAFGACSAKLRAKQKTVGNHPPRVPELQTSLKLESGRLKPESFSVLLWPEYASEQELFAAKRQAQDLNFKLDANVQKLAELLHSDEEKMQEFVSLECVKKYSLEPENGEPTDFVLIWKDAPTDENGEVDKKAEAELLTCQENQDTRESISTSQGQVQKENGPIVGDLKSIFDPDKDHPNGNDKSIESPRNSWIELSKGGADDRVAVKILLRDFVEVGNTQSSEPGKSTVDAGQIYDVQYEMTPYRILKFKVPELKDKKPTGVVYEFVVFRQDDIYEIVRFSGEVTLVQVDGKRRVGQVSFYGRMN